MAITPALLVTGRQVPDTTTTLYTSTNVVTRIDKLSVTNTTAGAVTITIYLVDTGSAGDNNTVTYQQAVNAGKTWNCPDAVGHILNAGGIIQAVASAAASLTVRAAGVQIT
jgi:hypothetical protein